MREEHEKRVIIPTLAHQMLKSATDTIVRTAGLGIIKGPVGIGKTFALNTIADELEARGVVVVMITSSPEIEGSIRAFCQAVSGYSDASKAGAADAMAEVLRGYPFRDVPSPLIFIVDEAQGLKTNILELLRSLWDRGDKAKLFDRNAPAFGLMLCGNDNFFNKSGRAKAAEFKPLRDRVSLTLNLPRPSLGEYAALASALLPENPDACAALASGGAERGTLR